MDRYKDILKRYWGYDDFRGIQREIIESIGAGHDTLGLMPTGGGKSITFQVPALSMPGVCIVVTPLISLMKDQVDNLRRRGITAYAIHSGLSHNDMVTVLDNCIYGDIKFLYVSPERLGTQFFRTKLQHINVSFITVDEAHCISQWGYDFRPAYLKIAEIRSLTKGKPILALTATATPAVVDDIQKQLNFYEGKVFRMSFKRSNISYIVRYTMDPMAEMIHILNAVNGTAIVYTTSRKRTKEVVRQLTEQGISADFYHAGLDTNVKAKRQQDWQEGRTRVIVATNAFGMGIDKPDVRLVIHVDVPTSIEAYFQEAGRAGRDGKRSYAVLLTGRHTTRILHNRIAQSFPSKDFIRDVYEHLAYFYEIGVGMGRNHSFLFPLDKFCLVNRYNIIETDAALRILTNAGYIYYDTDPDDFSRLQFTVARDELYRLHDLSTGEENLINTLMRFYSGMFTDYVLISENKIANEMGMSPEQVYMMLSELRRKHIISFIPPRTTPKITYLIDRVDGCDVKLRKEIYDSLKDVAENHVEAMIEYISNDVVCRQLQLVHYFGEDSQDDCNCCDVCIDRRKHNNTDNVRDKGQPTDVRQGIISFLSDRMPHNTGTLLSLPYPKDKILSEIRSMIEEEIVITNSITIKLA